jgi:transcriptional regulator with XRE-family HTH domain
MCRILCDMTATHGERTDTGWVPDDETLAARLAMIRHQKKWGGAARAGEVCGVSAETWRSWENGTNKNPRNFEAIVAKIARKSGCDVGWLYGGNRLKKAIDLDQLEAGLRKGLAGPIALVLALNRDIDPEILAAAPPSVSQEEGSEDTERYLETTNRPLPNRTNGYPKRPARPVGRPQTSQTSLAGPKPVRPARLPRSSGR